MAFPPPHVPEAGSRIIPVSVIFWGEFREHRSVSCL